MSKFDAEYNEAKNLVVEKIQQWVNEQKALKAAGTKISKSGVKQAERAKRSIISSTDETFGFLVEESLSKDLSGEAIKNKIRGLIERQFPKSLRLVSSDRIHHKNALELVELVSQQSPDVVLQFLQRSEKEGYFYGDSLENTRGASFTEGSHTGALPQDNASGINYPKEYGSPGEKLVSGHPAGTNDPRFKFKNKIYSSGDELFDSIKPALAFSADALDRALFADKPRQEILETLARNQGLLKPGENVRDLNPGPRLQAIQKFAEEPENRILIEGARKTPASYGKFLQSPRPNLTKFREQFPENPLSKLPMGSPELEIALGLDFSKSTATTILKDPLRHKQIASLNKLVKGASRVIPGSLDDVALGTGFGGIAAVGALATGGDPAQAFGDVVPDVAVGDLQGGELFDESQDFGEALKQSRQQNTKPLMDRLDEGALGDAGRAIKRGGRISFGFGGVKFTLPEYGYSELLGIN